MQTSNILFKDPLHAGFNTKKSKLLFLFHHLIESMNIFSFRECNHSAQCEVTITKIQFEWSLLFNLKRYIYSSIYNIYNIYKVSGTTAHTVHIVYTQSNLLHYFYSFQRPLHRLQTSLLFISVYLHYPDQ